MVYKTIILGDGGPCQVRVLELYELDKVPYEDPGEYQHTYPNGQTKIYTLANWPQGEPETPPIPEELCGDNIIYLAMWARWRLYQAVLSHRLRQISAGEKHAHDVARYILANCISPEDYPRVTSPADLEKIYFVALVAEVSREDIEAALASTFPGQLQWEFYFDGLIQPAARRGQRHQYQAVG